MADILGALKEVGAPGDAGAGPFDRREEFQKPKGNFVFQGPGRRLLELGVDRALQRCRRDDARKILLR